VILYSAICVLLKFIYKILFSFKVKGLRNVPSEGGFILASNHLSFLDPPALGVACPRPLNYLAREDLFDIPILGRLLRMVGVIPLAVDKPASPGTIKETIRRLKRGEGMVIFPEGTRSRDGYLQQGWPGIGLIAVKTGVPIIPVCLKGTEKALPRGAKFIRCKKISLCFGEKIEAGTINSSENRKDEYKNISQVVMGEIARLQEREE